MLGTDEIAARISNVLAAKLGIEANRVADTASMERDLGASSLDMVETIMEVLLTVDCTGRVSMD